MYSNVCVFFPDNAHISGITVVYSEKDELLELSQPTAVPPEGLCFYIETSPDNRSCSSSECIKPGSTVNVQRGSDVIKVVSSGRGSVCSDPTHAVSKYSFVFKT